MSGPGTGGGLPPLPSHLDPRGGRSGRSHSVPRYGRGGTAMLATKVLASMLSVFLVAFSAYFWWNYRDLNNGLHRLQVYGGQAASNGTTRPDIDGTDQNLLIIGNDNRDDLSAKEAHLLHTGLDASLSTDTMMIVHIPANGAKATLISLPRDSYVNIPGYGMNKLNAAYALGYTHSGGSDDAKRAAGINLMYRTIENLTGLTIDHFVEVGLLGFYRISNAIGGVTVDLCHAVDDSYSGLDLSAGKHTIKGVTALAFVRQRHGLTNGDLDRTERQRYFLTAAFRKIATAGVLLNPSKLRALIQAIHSSLYVDQNFNITSLAEQMVNLSANNIVGRAIPFQRFANVYIDGALSSVEIVSPARVQVFVNRLIGTSDTGLSSAKTVAPSTVTVSVLNGGAANGMATEAKTTLQRAGFHATAGDSSDQINDTTIEYAAGMESQAKTLQQYLPGVLVRKAAVSTLTLVLGSDGQQPRSTPTTTSPKSSTPAKHKAVDAGCVN